MPDNYAWLCYADLQKRSKNAPVGDYSWGLEAALDYLLEAIKTGTVPADPAELDATVKRTIASGGRLHRSRSLALKKWITPPESVPTSAAAEAAIELATIKRVVSETDAKILFDAGEGYTDREIACRHASTPGAIRVRLSRLRLKLAANGHCRTAVRSHPDQTGLRFSSHMLTSNSIAHSRSLY